MGGDRGGGEAALGAQGPQDEPVLFQDPQGAVGAGARAGGDGGALQDLAQVQGQARVEAPHHGQGGEHGGVVGASGNHHLAAQRQRLLYGFHTHLGHQRSAVCQACLVQRRYPGQRAHPALPQPRQRPFPGHIGADDPQAEGQLQLPGQLAHNGKRPLQVWPGPGAARAADHQRYVAAHRGLQQQRQVAPHRMAVGKGLAGAQVIGPRVGGARIHGDQVRGACQAALERVLREAVAEDRRG